MTNSKPRPRCIDCNVQVNSSNRTLDAHNGPTAPLCDKCYDIAGLENEHQDGQHDADGEYGPDSRCPMCTGVAIADASREGHAGTTVKRGSHAGCYKINAHEATKTGRAACRAKKTL